MKEERAKFSWKEDEGGRRMGRMGKKRREEEEDGEDRRMEDQGGGGKRKEDGELIQVPSPLYLSSSLVYLVLHLLVCTGCQRLLRLALTKTNTILMNGRQI